MNFHEDKMVAYAIGVAIFVGAAVALQGAGELINILVAIAFIGMGWLAIMLVCVAWMVVDQFVIKPIRRAYQDRD